MFDYPPTSHTGNSASRSTQMNHGYASTRIRTLQNLAKRKRFDISIGIQSALTFIYTAELVYYFVRLRHLAGTRPAAWRATIMFILLIVDVVLIWLTFRCKSNDTGARSSQQHLSTIVAGPAYIHRPAGGAQFDRGNHENPFADEMGPYYAEHPDTTASFQGPHAPQPAHGSHSAHPSLPAYNESGRSRLNTPITQ
ncbi:hypothetical protein GGH94_001555 [Coemansia aciculifera]|uniref:Uncharacterized protein n=1 Tax=Coemansia aciculifera TaxID=417176 RepID=A0A9W8M823_9FUNG|nr:hypothetical protein GGH94_001554 [Coemansia aciculifera]KAJ2866436.1 hypothetical protein GGH94_001555 [Coemansia aciculifera]KAJ2875829.1 hypothetical protein GGH93_001287 [Coemansia aciculifera]KAJ2875830.1 hypothetical protein GGH93_001288 [Coemansia aciculifera]